MAQPQTSTRKKLRALIADDVQETRRSTRLMLATIDNVEVVAIASNGVQAVEFAREHHPDIVLLDINMPEMDGLTAYREIAKIYPETGCIIISAEKEASTFQTAISAGVQEYLIKPFTVEELEIAVKRVHEQVEKAREQLIQTDQLKKRNEEFLKQLAIEYSKARRTDDQAEDVFEQLAENPECDPRWLQTLAMIYVVKQKWGKLRVLAEKIEKRNK